MTTGITVRITHTNWAVLSWLFVFTGLGTTVFNLRSIGWALKSLWFYFINILSCLCPPAADYEWLQRAPDHRQGRLRRSVRLQEGRHRKDVRRREEERMQAVKATVMLRPLVCNLCCVNVRYAMKCLDKKRIKMKQGETLALNERIMLSLVSTGVSGTPQGRVWSATSELQPVQDCNWQGESTLNWNWQKMFCVLSRLEFRRT